MTKVNRRERRTKAKTAVIAIRMMRNLKYYEKKSTVISVIQKHMGFKVTAR